MARFPPTFSPFSTQKSGFLFSRIAPSQPAGLDPNRRQSSDPASRRPSLATQRLLLESSLAHGDLVDKEDMAVAQEEEWEGAAVIVRQCGKWSGRELLLSFASMGSDMGGRGCECSQLWRGERGSAGKKERVGTTRRNVEAAGNKCSISRLAAQAQVVRLCHHHVRRVSSYRHHHRRLLLAPASQCSDGC